MWKRRRFEVIILREELLMYITFIRLHMVSLHRKSSASREIDNLTTAECACCLFYLMAPFAPKQGLQRSRYSDSLRAE